MSHVKGDAKTRKTFPVCTGVIDYFPDALLAVAEVSRVCSEQHNPGEPMRWAREKSCDEVNPLVRHLIDRGKLDVDGTRHSAKVAWRALASLQKEIEAERVSPRPEEIVLKDDQLPQDVKDALQELKEWHDRGPFRGPMTVPCFNQPDCCCKGKKDGGKTTWEGRNPKSVKID